MVGVPGKSKGCNTCRRRKIRVRALIFVSIVKLNPDGDFSATLKNHSARLAPKAVESVKDMHVFQSSSTVPCKVRKSDMASKKLRFPWCNHQNKICPSRSRCYPTLTSSGDSLKAAEPIAIQCLFSLVPTLHSTSRSSPYFGRSIFLQTVPLNVKRPASGYSKSSIFQPEEYHCICLLRLLQ